jgi:hypothetical protein
MPATYPHLDADTGELVPTTYYDVEEVADMLHVSANTVRRRLRDGEWDGLHPLARSWYMNAAQIADAVETMQTRVQREADTEQPVPLLGEPVDDHDLEPLR